VGGLLISGIDLDVAPLISGRTPRWCRSALGLRCTHHYTCSLLIYDESHGWQPTRSSFDLAG
jgi:hypothetical protein